MLALPRGGVPVGREVADALAAPLDVIVVRKLGVPQQPELAMGAIGEGDVIVSDPDTIRVARVTESQWNRVVEQEQAELQRRTKRYPPGRPTSGHPGPHCRDRRRRDRHRIHGQGRLSDRQGAGRCPGRPGRADRSP